MARFVKADIVVVPFPFSDLTDSKRRPALVVNTLQGDDLILCQITTQFHSDPYSIALQAADFVDGKLHQPSNIRPNRLFTADRNIILYKAGAISAAKHAEVIAGIEAILRT